MTDKTFYTEATPKTPEINFYSDKGFLEIKGQSLPVNAFEFYQPLFVAVNEYLKKPQSHTEILIQLHYFNTSSSKLLFQLLHLFENLNEMGKQAHITWAVEQDDPDMIEAGETFQSSIKLPFTLTELQL